MNNYPFIIVDMQKNTLLVTHEQIQRMLSALSEPELIEMINDHMVRHETLPELDRDIHG